MAQDFRLPGHAHLLPDRAGLDPHRGGPGACPHNTQNARARPVASPYSVRPTPDARVSTPLSWDEVPDCEPEAFTLATVPARFSAIGDPGAGIDAEVGSLEALLELAARQEAAGLPDAPWPPNYPRQPGEAPRVQPSRARGRSGAV